MYSSLHYQYVAGGIAQISLKSNKLSNFVFKHEEQNHLFAVESLLRNMLPPYGMKKCKLFSSLTDSGNISLILEAVNPGDHQECKDAVLKVINNVNRNKTARDVNREFEMAAFLDLENWAEDTMMDIQDKLAETADDLKNQAAVKSAETLNEFDNKVDQLPSHGACAVPGTVLIYLSFNILLTF